MWITHFLHSCILPLNPITQLLLCMPSVSLPVPAPGCLLRLTRSSVTTSLHNEKANLWNSLKEGQFQKTRLGHSAAGKLLNEAITANTHWIQRKTTFLETPILPRFQHSLTSSVFSLLGLCGSQL